MVMTISAKMSASMAYSILFKCVYTIDIIGSGFTFSSKEVNNSRLMQKFILIFLLFSTIVEADNCADSNALPANVQTFVIPGTRPIALEAADLNGDGLKDYILVLEKQKAASEQFETNEEQRPLLILIADSTGALKKVKQNNKIVFCVTCGGIMGDPFVEVVAKKNSFTVYHYGGSSWRWAVNYKFNYSKRDNTWQLVRVASEHYHSGNPSEAEKSVSTPPTNYGKIDIQDFDPEHWKGVGKR